MLRPFHEISDFGESDDGLSWRDPPIDDSYLPPTIPYHSSQPVAHRIKKHSGPNRIKKGMGPDAKPDLYDHYPYKEGHFYNVIVRPGEIPPASKIVFRICDLAERADVDRRLSWRDRWAKRRIANAYAWLDLNEKILRDSDVLKWYSEVKFE
jgi:hypothetical protein